MSAEKQYTYSDVSEHASKKDLFVVIHDKVYNASSFVDEHPGGEEVMLDVGGQDATEAFEDVGHSDEAREILEGMLVGSLKRQVSRPQNPTAASALDDTLPDDLLNYIVPLAPREPGDPEPKASAPTKPSGSTGGDGAGMGLGLYAIVLVGGALAFAAYQYMQAKSEQQ